MKQEDLLEALLLKSNRFQVKRNDILEEMLKPTCPLTDDEKIRLVAYMKKTTIKSEPVFQIL